MRGRTDDDRGGLLDLELLVDLASLDEGPGSPYMAQLLDDFALDARSAIERMRSLADSGRSCAIAREAHRLRGSSGSIGAAGLANGYREIERGARSGATNALFAQIEQTSRLLEVTVEAMRDFLRPRRAGGPMDSMPGF